MRIGQKKDNKADLSLTFKISHAASLARYKFWNVYPSIYLTDAQRGQALLESLVSFSVFFIFVFGILYFSLLYHTKLWLHHISYENAVCLYYENKQSHKCLIQARKFIIRAFPYLKQVRISFQSGLSYKESIIQAYFPLHTQIIARQSFYAKY